MEAMEAYKRWVRKNRKSVPTLIRFAKGLTWLLPVRFSETEIGLEAVRSIFDIMNAVNKHIIKTTPSKMQTLPPESSSFPYSLCLTLLKDTETLVEVVAQHYFGDDDKWNFIAVMEATKVLARLALLKDSGYKMLLHGRETMNDQQDSNDASQQLGCGRFLQQGKNGTSVKRPTLLSFLSEKGLHGGLFLTGEFMFIARPLVYVLLIRKYGLRSWIPWIVSFSIDHIAMSSSTMSLTNHKDQCLSLSDPEKDELRRRKKLLGLYLLREPCFGKYIWQRLKSTNKTVKRVPIVRSYAGKMVRRLVGTQRRYTYISGS